MKISDVVVVDEDILGGTPVFKGTRVPIKNLFDYLEAGDSLNDFLTDFTHISRNSCILILKTSEKLLAESEIISQSEEKIKSSDFRGKLKLTEKEHADFQTHLRDIRDEWDA
jgi:uncharacterized protein (DUF433 family)